MITLCVLAFLLVFVLLAVLALSMLLIELVLPEREEVLDATLVAAVSGTVAALHPGARVTKIEEES
ncbi:MAG: hypothetical protein GF328_10775 [Candidatus Latescibacteria bacterium]|nr:hypothetical protein [Candidatus Latescibacterota bacterium]